MFNLYLIMIQRVTKIPKAILAAFFLSRQKRKTRLSGQRFFEDLEGASLLGCPRKLGSMVCKWVISPTYKYGIPWGEITH